MLEKVYMVQLCAALRLKAANKYNIAPEKCHIGHLMLQGMLQKPNAICQIDAATHESETNISVAKRCARLADALNKSGMKPGDPIIIMGYNHLDIAIPYYACHFNGHSVSCMDPNIAPNDLIALFPYLKPKMVFCQKACVDKVRKAFQANNLEETRIVTFDDNTNNLETFIQEHKGSEVGYRPAEFDHFKTNAWLMLTSGTTGLPKIAMITYDTVLNGMCCWWQPHTRRYTGVLAMACLQWISSQIFFAAAPLRCLTRIQSSEPITAPALIGIINKYKPDVTAWTPFFVNQFIIAAEKGLCDLSCFHSIFIGGGRIEKPLLDRFQKLCPDAWLFLTYGMTELLVPVFHFDDSVPVNSAGYPNKRYQFKLVDEDGNTVEKPFKNGELWLKGDDFFTGYMNNPEETKIIYTEDGWFKTGDIFYKDDDDFYYFVERQKLLIKHLGYLIAPLQMEEVIKQHPGVFEACVVGVPDPDRMEVPIAAIQRRNGDKVDPEDIFAMFKKTLPDHKQLSGGLFFIEAFPVTASGKINRSQLRDIAISATKIMPKDV